MSQLRSNPVREVPKRVLLISLVVTTLIIGITIIFDWPTNIAVIGFWMGVVINLINFRIIVIGSKNYLERVEAGKRASMTPNIILRFLLYGMVFLIAWRAIGIPALLASFVGACMVNFAFKSDGFFTMGLGKKDGTDLKRRAVVDRVEEIDKRELDEANEIEPSETDKPSNEIEEIEKAEKTNKADRIKIEDKDRALESNRILDSKRSKVADESDNKQEEEEEIEVFL